MNKGARAEIQSESWFKRDSKFGFRQTKFIVMTEYGGGGPQEAAGDVRLIRAVRAVDICLELIPREVNV